jgi:hypothetical protein
VGEGEEGVGACRGGEPQSAREQAVVEEHRSFVVERGDQVDGIDDTERGIGDELPGLDGTRIREEACGRPIVREPRERAGWA